MKERLCCLLCILVFSVAASAQVHEKNTIDSVTSEDDVILVLRFEPELDITANKKRALFKRERLHIDTMHITEKKKERLLRKLYKDIHSGKFQKTILTPATFENELEN